MPKFIFFQPEYVKNFKCDGIKCGAQCCRKWIVYVDKATYDSYVQIEKFKGEITDKLIYDDKEKYVVQLDDKKDCPFLTAENLCAIQKNYGEKFLSTVCQTFPRHIIKLDDICECSLSLACPIAAESALKPSASMNFEFVEKSFSDDSKIGAITTEFENFSAPQIFKIQTAAIFILQERTLTIDQRLAVLGIFLYGLEKILSQNSQEFDDLIETFSSEKFITGTALNILSDVPFNPKDFIRLMFCGIFEGLYSQNLFQDFELETFDDLNKILKLQPDSNGTISISAAAENFIALNNLREKFCEHYKTILENYLVNEFFKNFYSWTLKKSIHHNYALFVATYKLTEIFLFVLAQNFPSFDEDKIIKYISQMARNIDHTAEYIEKISAELEGKDDTLKIISTFLQI